jgi:hypothetical protein
MPLENLSELIANCKKVYKDIPSKDKIVFSDQFSHEFCKAYGERWSSDSITYASGTYRIESTGGAADISDRWMLYAHAFAPLCAMIGSYKNVLNDVLEKSGINNLSNKNEILKKIPGENWASNVDVTRKGTAAGIAGNIKTCLDGDTEQIAHFERFISDPYSWLQGKNFSRNEDDWIGSSLMKAAGVIQANADRLPRFITTIVENDDLRLMLEQSISGDEILNVNREIGGKNTIFYGAPGTGKSYRIDKEELLNVDEKQIIRTIFHSETQSSDFMGSLKPTIENDDLTYKFQPGPFSISLSKSLSDPSSMYYLIIEEINRAPAAAVFGEIFQLLDRDASGEGEYDITVSDPSQEVWLKNNIPNYKSKIKMPSNLTLLATMNSSDQGVMPMDTAFKRRWMFEYIPISFEKCASGYVSIPINKQFSRISWADLALKINQLLSQQRIPEDRHLGPWFVNENELIPVGTALDSKNQLSAVLIGKLFIYLWDDILRHGQRHYIFSKEINTYGELVSAYTTGKNIFCDDLVALLDDIAEL